jgi:D-aminopeptidase
MSQLARHKAAKTVPPHKQRRQLREATALARYAVAAIQATYADMLVRVAQHNVAVAAFAERAPSVVH